MVRSNNGGRGIQDVEVEPEAEAEMEETGIRQIDSFHKCFEDCASTFDGVSVIRNAEMEICINRIFLKFCSGRLSGHEEG